MESAISRSNFSNDFQSNFQLNFHYQNYFLYCQKDLINNSLRTLDYGAMSRYPDTWLQEGILNGDDEMKASVLANALPFLV